MFGKFTKIPMLWAWASTRDIHGLTQENNPQLFFSHNNDIFWYYSNLVNRLNLQIQLNVIGWIENVAVSNKIAKTNILGVKRK